MRKSFIFLMLFALSLTITNTFAQDCFVPVWEDEFDGSELDPTKWRYQIGGGHPESSWGWGNGEEQFYTNFPENLSVSNGTLKISATNSGMGTWNYTSARIVTKGNFDFKYGILHFRYKCPSGGGLWPAIWLLPSYDDNWPASGEIDVMENFGHQDGMAASLHYNDWSNNHTYDSYGMPMTRGQWHEVMVAWSEDEIVFMYDGWQWASTANPGSLSGNWPFNEHFYMILNLALGGSAGTVNATLPADFELDFVRIKQKISDIEIQGSSVATEGSAYNNYSLPNVDGAGYTWSVPNGATITSGQGTNEINVEWGSTSGNVTCSATTLTGDIDGNPTNCGNITFTHNVTLKASECVVMIEDYENHRNTIQSQVINSFGVYRDLEPNPNKSGINTSDWTGKFGRSGSLQYDYFKMDLNKDLDVSVVSGGDDIILVDVYNESETPGAGIPLTVQLTNNPKNDGGHPNGIYAQYTGVITTQGQWETVELTYLDSPDETVLASDVNQIAIMPNAGNQTATVYYFDNIRFSNVGISDAPALTGSTTVQYRSAGEKFAYSFENERGSVYAWSGSNGASVDGSSTGTSVDIVFDDPGNGTYDATVTLDIITASGCIETISETITVENTVNVNDIVSENYFSLYPNPSSGLFNLEVNSEVNSIAVYDMSGRMIQHLQANSNIIQLGQNWEQGVYILKINGININKEVKLIKQ